MEYRLLLHFRSRTGAIIHLALVALTLLGVAARAQVGSTDNSLQREIGVIKAIDDNGIAFNSDSGNELHISLQNSTRILRVAPGEKDLKNAVPLQKQDLQVGDRILVRGKPAADPHSISASAVIVMKQSDVAAKRDKEREDWQKRGTGGLVTAVDESTSTLTISVTSFTGTKNVAIHTTKNTVLRRYAPNSVKFDEAKLAPLDQIKVGDQLRARGNKNPDGTEVAAEEIVSGAFRNLAGQILSVDPEASTLALKDTISKQTVTVKVGAYAQLRKLPPEFAQRIAMRLKGAAAAGIPGAGAALGREEHPRGQGTGQLSGGPSGAGGGMGGRNGGPPDIQQILNRMPPVSLPDLQKGDVVMIVSTQSDATGTVSAITLLAGVESILTAAPSASQAMMLSPWSLGSGSAEAAANP